MKISSRRDLVIRGVAMILGVMAASNVAAQEGSRAIRLGPIGLTPAVRAGNIGIDNNVFNDSENPQKDFTAVISPSVQARGTILRTRVFATSNVGFTYFSKFTTQRSASVANDIRAEVPLNRVLPFVSYSWSSMRSRPNQEIDARVENGFSGVAAGADVRVGPRMLATLQAHRGRTAFGKTEDFQGVNLSRALDRTTKTFTGSLRYQATALTRISVAADVQQSDFDFSPGRRSTSYALRPRVEFAPSALITGTASLGYQRFDIVNPAVPDYSGLTASIDLGYVLRDTTRLGFRATREVMYSLSDIEPYYLQTGLGLTVTQQLTSVWSAAFGTGRQTQNYRRAVPASPVAGAEPTTGALSSYQVGVGYRASRNARVDFDVSHGRRTGGLAGDYQGTRAFTTISYEY